MGKSKRKEPIKTKEKNHLHTKIFFFMFSIKSTLNPSNLVHTCAAMVAECAKHGKSTSKDMLQNRLIKEAYFFQELKKCKKEEKFIVIPQTISLPELLGDSNPYTVYTHMYSPPPCYIKGLFKLQKREKHRTLPLLAAWLHDLVSHLFRERKRERGREEGGGFTG